MKVKLFILSLLCIILFAGNLAQVHAASGSETVQKGTENLANLSDQIFQYTSAHQYSAAASLLKELNGKWQKSSPHYSDTQQQVIHSSLANLDLLLKNPSASRQEATRAAISVRLAFDALEPEGRHLWKNLRSEVLTPMTQMKQSLQNKNDQRFQYYLNVFLDEYSVIYPALVINGPSDMVASLDQRISSFSSNRLQDTKAEVRIRQIKTIEQELNLIFNQTTDNHEESTGTLITVISALVVCMLAYVSWKRFALERLRGKKMRLLRK